MPYVRADEYFDIVLNADVDEDTIIVSGGLVGVTKFAHKVADGEPAKAYLAGEYRLAKNSAEAFQQGDPVYYNETSRSLTSAEADSVTEADNVRLGVCSRDSSLDDAHVFVFLNR